MSTPLVTMLPFRQMRQEATEVRLTEEKGDMLAVLCLPTEQPNKLR
jgi:hypothetical protein